MYYSVGNYYSIVDSCSLRAIMPHPQPIIVFSYKTDSLCSSGMTYWSAIELTFRGELKYIKLIASSYKLVSYYAIIYCCLYTGILLPACIGFF